MQNELTIRCTHGTDTHVPLIGKFTDKQSRKKIILLSNFGVLIDQEPTASQIVFKYSISKNNPVFSFKWDSTDTAKAEFAKWLKKHPHINHADNLNKDAQTYFVLEDKTRQDEILIATESAKHALWFMIHNMDLKQLMDVAYMGQMDPAGKSATNIFNELVGWDNGILMANPMKFLADKKLPDYGKKVIIRKAVMLGVIKTQETDGKSIFIINNTPVGSVENLLVYFNENPEQYKYIQQEVAGTDILPYGITENISVEEAISSVKKERKDTTLSAAKKEENKATREATQHDNEARKNIQVARLKELGVGGWQASGSWSEEKRLEKITIAEKEPALA